MNRTLFRYLAIEGVIGAGKTSLAEKLSEWYGAYLIREIFEENPFLADFYKDRQRFAFQTQIFFLISRFKQQESLRQYDLFHNKIISDYIFQKDRIFATLNLSEAEMKLYDSIARLMEKQIVKPDFIIYLKCSTERLMFNIHKRGREIEKDMDENYIDQLNRLYNNFFQYYESTNLIVLDTEKIDFIENEADFKNIVELINTKTNRK